MFVAYFGGFKPPHKGHLAVVEEYLSMPDVLSVYIIYGNKTRSSKDHSIKLRADHTRSIWDLFVSTLDEPTRVKLIEAEGNTLVEAANLAWSPDLAGSTITAGYGPKEPEYGTKFINVIRSLQVDKGSPLTTPVMVPTSSNEPSISSTMIRNALATNDVSYLEGVVPPGVCVRDYINILKAAGERI